MTAILRTAFTLDLALTPVARGSLSLVVDDELGGRDYVVRRSDESGDDTVFGTYVVRVGVAIGVTADLFTH